SERRGHGRPLGYLRVRFLQAPPHGGQQGRRRNRSSLKPVKYVCLCPTPRPSPGRPSALPCVFPCSCPKTDYFKPEAPTASCGLARQPWGGPKVCRKVRDRVQIHGARFGVRCASRKRVAK